MNTKTWVISWIIALGILGSQAAIADRGHWHGGRVGIGLSFGAPFYDPWFYGPFYPRYYSPYAYPPVIVSPPPPVTYVEQGSNAAAATSSTLQSGYWYYCEAARGYYPYVKTCPAGWLAVAPEPQDK